MSKYDCHLLNINKANLVHRGEVNFEPSHIFVNCRYFNYMFIYLRKRYELPHLEEGKICYDFQIVQLCNYFGANFHYVRA